MRSSAYYKTPRGCLFNSLKYTVRSMNDFNGSFETGSHELDEVDINITLTKNHENRSTIINRFDQIFLVVATIRLVLTAVSTALIILCKTHGLANYIFLIDKNTYKNFHCGYHSFFIMN